MTIPENIPDRLIAVFDDPQYRDEYGLLTAAIDDAIARLAAEFDWRQLTSGLIRILQQEPQRHWYDATAALYWFQCDGHLQLPCEPSYLIALLYDCLQRHPSLGGRQEEGECENLVWSIVHTLKGVGYLSDYDPLDDPDVLKHDIVR
jgi:hypothetical protein